MNPMPSFDEYFRALWGYGPFPWQSMLARRVCENQWPKALDLPTAAGKTACLDIALYALAAQEERGLGDRTAPRRTWFVVDRRIVVDEAFDRAQAIAQRLSEAKEGALKSIADRLRRVAGTGRPLAVARLRGGVLRDDNWARLPSQPAAITSTVDQLGSRFLFRGYGHSMRTASIFAGLAANDSLILLDEAHCAVPFLESLRAIERYRSGHWARVPLRTPFAFAVMSATPPSGIHPTDVFPGEERDVSLDHPVLDRRLRTRKTAELVELKASRGDKDPLVKAAADHAREFLHEGRQRIGVMVNRVRTAAKLADELHGKVGNEAYVLLLTGRIRPFERDRFLKRWSPLLRAREPKPVEKPIVVVSTQCLEVGADFSFEALVTECASLDALRQRFGRLARMGLDDDQAAPAVILMRSSSGDDEDPIYGSALGETWNWLSREAGKEEGVRRIDFGFAALADRLRMTDDLSSCLAPAPDSPMLLPAHLDLLCQTSPPASPEPAVSLYLHGRNGPPEAQVVWRCDLSPASEKTWCETVALCPPASGEMLTVPLASLRRWLAQDDEPDGGSDVEGAGIEESSGAPGERFRRCLLWRGRDGSTIAKNPDEIGPGDVVVVPAAYGMEGLGHRADCEALGQGALDLFELVREQSLRGVVVRLTRDVLAPWLSCRGLRELLDVAELPVRERGALREAIHALLDDQPPGMEDVVSPPQWWLDLLHRASGGRVEEHPAGGLVLLEQPEKNARWRGERDLFADDDDLLSAAGEEVSLADHTRLVQRSARRLADLCLPRELAGLVELAACWHDAGKLDERFQVLLHRGDEVAAAGATEPLAKSASIPTSPAHRRKIREASRFPDGFRHEFLSAQIAALHAPLPQEAWARELVLHLIASHHGHARPFAPLCHDSDPPGVRGVVGQVRIDFPAAHRAQLPPSHRYDSGCLEQFWRLSRRFGWWGLAYLEAVFRLSDWYGSSFVIDER